LPQSVKGLYDGLVNVAWGLLFTVPGWLGVCVGLIARLMFFPGNFVLGQVFSSLENIGLLFGMILLALVVVWVLDTCNWKIRALGNVLFLSLLALSLIGAVILVLCLYTGEVSLISFGIPISISLVSVPVLVYYCILFIFYHLVWEEYCIEFVTVCILLFAAIYTENIMASLFALSFSLIIIATLRDYGKMGYASHDVMIYRFGKPTRKRTMTFFVLPFIEEFRPVSPERAHDERGLLIV
jgi:hypothetical protein